MKCLRCVVLARGGEEWCFERRVLTFDCCIFARATLRHPSTPRQHGPIYCIWESKEGATLDEMQTFIDGKDGPGMGMMINTCRAINLQMAGSPPTAPFFKKK